MRLVISNYLPLVLSLSLFPRASMANPAVPFLTQIESHSEDTAMSTWQGFLDLLAGKPQTAGDLVVNVTDSDGNPLAGASVLAGQAIGVPFNGNQAVTNANGIATFTNPSLRGQSIAVTASIDGFTTASLLDNKDNHVHLALERIPNERGYGFVRGRLNGIPHRGSGDLELGVFLPAANMSSLLNFDVQSLISSYTVKVDIYGKRDVPGNVVLPSQTKYYGFIPINVSKPEFIMPLPTTTNAHMYGIGGSVNVGGAVGLVQKKDYLGIVNLMAISTVGWTTDRVQIHGDENFDVNATHNVIPNNVTATLSGISGLDSAGVSLLDLSGDKSDLVVMDAKTLKSEELHDGNGTFRLGQIQSSMALASSYIFTALFDRTQFSNASRWVVGSIKPAGNSRAVPFQQFLSPIKPKNVDSSHRNYQFTSPAGNGLEPTMMLISVVSEKKNDETMGRTRKVLWSILLKGSTDHIALPDLGHPVLPAPDLSKDEKFHWEVTAIRVGSSHTSEGTDLQASLKDLQDVSTLQQAY